MNAWEQQPNEDAKQFKAFQCYLKERSIDAAYKEYSKDGRTKKARKSPKGASGAFKQWFKMFAWEERAKAYNAYLQEQMIQGTVTVRRDEFVKRSEIYRANADKLHKAVIDKLEGSDKLSQVKLGELIDAVKFYEAEHLSELERVNLVELKKTMENA